MEPHFYFEQLLSLRLKGINWERKNSHLPRDYVKSFFEYKTQDCDILMDGTELR